MLGLDIANTHRPTARNASTARTSVARIRPITQVIRKREKRKISRLICRKAPPFSRLPPSACPTYWIRKVHAQTCAATLKN